MNKEKRKVVNYVKCTTIYCSNVDYICTEFNCDVQVPFKKEKLTKIASKISWLLQTEINKEKRKVVNYVKYTTIHCSNIDYICTKFSCNLQLALKKEKLTKTASEI